MRKGFTLIELLVVVLIMGILASVAMPKYFLAVEKARMTEVVEFTRAWMSAQDRYWMKTGGYASSLATKLDIDYPVESLSDSYIYTTYYVIEGNYPVKTIKFSNRRKTAAFYGQGYTIMIDFDRKNSPLRITKVYCSVSGSDIASKPCSALLSPFESFKLNCSGDTCLPKE